MSEITKKETEESTFEICKHFLENLYPDETTDITTLHLQLKAFKELKAIIERRYEGKKTDIYRVIDATIGNSPETYVDVPDHIGRDPELIKSYVLQQEPEAVITNMDLEKMIVRLYVPAKYRRWSHESEFGKIERRITRGKTWVDLDLLRLLDEDLWEEVTTSERVLDEKALVKIMAEDEEAADTIHSAVRTSKPSPGLYLTKKKAAKEEEGEDDE